MWFSIKLTNDISNIDCQPKVGQMSNDRVRVRRSEKRLRKTNMFSVFQDFNIKHELGKNDFISL